MRLTRLHALLAAALLLPLGAASPPPTHNLIVFVADGLRYGIVSAETAPALDEVRRQGVDFRNSHSLYPTITTPNASAIATGHRIGDTGDFGNAVFLGQPALSSTRGALLVNYENDPNLGAANERFGGNYLNEETLLAAARRQGFATAALGKLGPAAIQDVTARDGATGIVIDDSTGTPQGIPLPADLAAAIAGADLPTTAPARGPNGVNGATTANIVQQGWFAAVAAKVVLPRLAQGGKPFVMVYWSRDPDGSQHGQGDSIGKLVPGINGPTSLAGIRNASDNLQTLRDTLKTLGLEKTTDILVTSDHGFSTVSKESRTSPSAKVRYDDVPEGQIPPGFLALDLGKGLDLPVRGPAGGEPIAPGAHPPVGGSILGRDPGHPDVVVGANGGSDLIWLPGPDPRGMARRIVRFLTTQDYTAALFVDDALGPIPGTLPLSRIGLTGAAVTPRPSIVVAFRSYSTGCAQPLNCGVDVSDTEWRQGQGMHGSFGRADTRNFMAAVGPSFKSGYVDRAPVSNADLAWTAARILKLKLEPKGAQVGRAITEALKGGSAVRSVRRVVRSAKSPNGFYTELHMQQVGRTPYFDVAGMPGRVLGLPPR